MAKLASIVLILSLITIIILQSSYPAMSAEVGDVRRFNYHDESGNIGPVNWGNIKPEWFMCKNGTMQSPIDLLNPRVKTVTNLGPLEIKYNPSNATLINRGHDIMLKFIGNSSYAMINGSKYILRQLHTHSPSEHAIDGKRFDLELHLFHQTPVGKMAVIGVLFKIGTPNPFLSTLRTQLVAISKTIGTAKPIGVVEPNLIKFAKTRYYRYMGSLTTPPCTQDVIWTIVSEVQSVSKEQIQLLRVSVHDQSNTNARPLQPLNNRLVELNKQGLGPKI